MEENLKKLKKLCLFSSLYLAYMGDKAAEMWRNRLQKASEELRQERLRRPEAK